MFELYDRGYTSLFAQLVACIVSIRTYDEVTIPCSLRLFELGRTPEEIAARSPEEVTGAIEEATFAGAKGPQIHEIAVRTVEEWGGELPCEESVLRAFRGVGPKCANLALGVACGKAKISVDIHVHRVTNRWGYVAAPTPEKTMVQLEEILPEKYRIEINRLLVPFGKHICRGVRPKCHACPLLDICAQIGVDGELRIKS